MKKCKKGLILLAILALLPMGVFAKDKVNVYMFKKVGCPHCENALTFFDGLDEEYKSYFNLITKDVSESGTDALLKKIVNYFHISMKGVPFIVIGDKTFEGFNEETPEQLKTAIKEAYENETPDVVAPLMITKKKNSTSILWVILAIIVGIVFLSNVAKEKDEEIEEVAPKKKTTPKKTTTPKTTASEKKTTTTLKTGTPTKKTTSSVKKTPSTKKQTTSVKKATTTKKETTKK